MKLPLCKRRQNRTKKNEVTLRYWCAENEDDKQTDNYNRGFAVCKKGGKHPETPVTQTAFLSYSSAQDNLGLPSGVLKSLFSTVVVGDGGLTMVMGGEVNAGLAKGVMSCRSNFMLSPTSPLPTSDLVSPISDLVSSSWWSALTSLMPVWGRPSADAVLVPGARLRRRRSRSLSA